MGALLTFSTSTPDYPPLSKYTDQSRAPAYTFSGSERTIVEASAVFILRKGESRWRLKV